MSAVALGGGPGGGAAHLRCSPDAVAVAGHRLILVGIGVAAMLHASTSYVLTRTDINGRPGGAACGSPARSATRRGTGVRLLGALLLVLLPGCRRGRPTAARPASSATTPRPAWASTSAAAGTALLIARRDAGRAGTAAAGPVAFVAFLSGPIARRLLPAAASRSWPRRARRRRAGAGGGVRSVNALPDTALPVGVVTGLLGAPFLLWLLVPPTESAKEAEMAPMHDRDHAPRPPHPRGARPLPRL